MITTASGEPVTLHTARLIMRPARPGDEDAIFALHADPVVMRYWDTPPWTDGSRAEQVVRSDQAVPGEDSYLRLALTRRSEDRVIGFCTLFALSRPFRRAEVGYLLAREAWGQGYMGEALGAMLDFAFGPLDLNRVEAELDPRNTASARLLERHGFRREGLLRERCIVAGERSDSALYGLIARDRRPDA